MKRWMVFALCLMLLVPVALAEQTDDFAVRVGDRTYSAAEVQNYLNGFAQKYVDEGVALTAAEQQELMENVVEGYVNQGVIANKCEELQLDQMTDAEETEIAALAGDYLKQVTAWYTAQIAAQYGKTEEEAAKYAPILMELEGVTEAYAQTQARATYLDSKVLNYVAGGLTLTDKEIKTYYRKHYVAYSEDAYQNDIAAYERDILYTGGDSYYTPYGYRLIEHIQFELSDSLYESLAASTTALSQAESEYAEALIALDQATVNGNSTDAEKTRCETCKKALDTLKTERAALEKQAFDETAENVQLVTDALAVGADFTELARQYSVDQNMPEGGYMVHKQSVMWVAAFRDTAMALAKPGDVSAPILTDAGVHILRYFADVEGGETPLEGDLLAAVSNEALGAAQQAALAAQIVEWKKEYDIATHPEYLSIPAIFE